MARRYHAREPQVGSERWVVSYADFITLLLAFFVVMYSISSVNEGKYRALSTSLSGIFMGAERSANLPVGDYRLREPDLDIGLIDQQAASVAGRAEQVPEDAQSQVLTQIQADVKAGFQELIADGQLSITANNLWLEIEIGSGVLFASGRAVPNLSADPMLEALAILLAPYANPIHVEGHTDNQPMQSDLFPSNWELSAARAAGVVRMLAHFGVDPARMAAAGYAQYQPKVSNLNASGRSKNRRVVIIVSRDESVRRALSGYGSGTLDEDAVETILQQRIDLAEPVAPVAEVQRLETESGGVLFTSDESQLPN
ncbi:MAG: chemotaxis protein MotB [Motiliproteus sp.]|jgi:chemotaxis protein MotB